MKPGWRTTEFWLTLAAIIASIVANGAGGLVEVKSPAVCVASIIAAGLAAAGYGIARGLAKRVSTDAGEAALGALATLALSLAKDDARSKADVTLENTIVEEKT